MSFVEWKVHRLSVDHTARRSRTAAGLAIKKEDSRQQAVGGQPTVVTGIGATFEQAENSRSIEMKRIGRAYSGELITRKVAFLRPTQRYESRSDDSMTIVALPTIQ